MKKRRKPGKLRKPSRKQRKQKNWIAQAEITSVCPNAKAAFYGFRKPRVVWDEVCKWCKGDKLVMGLKGYEPCQGCTPQ